MRHLSPEELLDLADGTISSPSAHLRECEECRAELDQLRATLMEVHAVNVPEPSPLFWDHFSARVRQAVEADGDISASRVSWWSWRVIVPVASVAVLAVVAALSFSSRGQIQSPPQASSTSSAASPAGPSADAVATSLEESAQFDLVADLATDAGLDTVREAGLLDSGAADRAMTHMNDDELRELARLIRAEIGQVQPS
jgi:hypothetical protein